MAWAVSATAHACAERSLGDVARFEAEFYRPRGLNIMAWIRRELGDYGPARSLAKEALSACEHDGVFEGDPAANALLALAESAPLAGDEGEALRRLDEVETHAHQVGFAWRIELRRLELLGRIEPDRCEELLERARHHGSAKYEALALAQLGALREATDAAQRTASPWLLARVAPQAQARAMFDELAGRLPADLRVGFVARGPLARHLAVG